MLPKLAGSAAYGRGLDYFRAGRVQLLQRLEHGFDAQAQGTASYQLWFRDNADGLLFTCSCPAADGGNFCKHLVAGTLAWLGNADAQTPVAPEEDALLKALKREPKARLAQWLYAAAMDDAGLAKKLQLQLSTDDPKEMKRALGAMLNTGGFLDYRRSMEYAHRLATPLSILEDLLERDPAQCLALSEYALSRLLKIYERADDSAGSIGDAIHAFAELHARTAAAAKPDGVKFAGVLFKLKCKDDWGLFPLPDYWAALGDKGQRAYARRVEADYAKLPATPASVREDLSQWLAESPVVRRREELAHTEGDLDTLIDVISRDLSSGHAYEKIVRACREFKRYALAMAWAERGLKADPNWRGMRVLVAEEFARAGLTEEARELLWTNLMKTPTFDAWQRLKQAAGEPWPELRAKALAELAAKESRTEDGRRIVSLRVDLLRLDGDLAAARELTLQHAVHPDLLVTLAKELSATHPEDASAFVRRAMDAGLDRADAKTYKRFVPLIKRAVELDGGEKTRNWVAAIRNRYKQRPKLMGLMDKAGLP